jgi:hypothetical protein
MPCPGFSMEHTLANERVWRVGEDVRRAWYDLEDALLGALEHDDLGTPYLAECEASIAAALRRLEEAEKLAHADVAATQAMLKSEREDD